MFRLSKIFFEDVLEYSALHPYVLLLYEAKVPGTGMFLLNHFVDAPRCKLSV